MMAHPRPYYQSEYGAKYKEPEVTVPMPLEQKVAGLSSLSSKAVREPAFTQKRKMGSQGSINDRVVQGMKFSEDKINLENQALRFKSGVRRPVEKWPTEYKLQYGWKATPPVPVLQAHEALGGHHRDPACPNKPVSQVKPVDQDWSVESVDGDSCDPADSDLESPTEQKRVITATGRPATAAVKKRQQLQRQKRKSRVQSATHKKSPRMPQDAITTQDKFTVPMKIKSQPQVPPSSTLVKKKTDQDDDTSDNDTDSQTGQKIQPPQRTTTHHHKSGHKKRKKRSVKRKLVWPMVTEYQSQYKIKPVPNVTDGDDDKPPAGSPQKLVDNSDPRLLKHSPMKMFKPQPDNAKFISEYLANYQSPTKVKYKEGAWSGVSPPHLLPQGWTTNAADRVDGGTNPDTGNWFNQVLELRRLAAAYRQRAEGTHFVQVHLADIEGEDDGDEVSSTPSSSSISHHQHPPAAPPPKSQDPHPRHTKPRDPKCYDPIVPVTKPHTRTPLIKLHNIKAPSIGSHDPQDDIESNSSTPISATHRDTEPPTGQGLQDNEASLEEESEDDEPRGRLPTPELKQIPPARKIRHHLDRTTPCKGAILTSPPKEARHGWNPEEDEDEEDPLTGPTLPPGVTKILPRYRRDMNSRAPIYPTSTTHTMHQQDKHPVTILKKSGISNSRKTVPKQLRDTRRTQAYVTSKKPTSTNRNVGTTENEDLECSFCGSMLRQPLQKTSRLMGDNKPLAMHGISTTQPPPAASRNVQKPHLPLSQPLSQQQPLSGSLLSLSSCSVASEVLQRAQHRKATFWNQRETTAT